MGTPRGGGSDVIFGVAGPGESFWPATERQLAHPNRATSVKTVCKRQVWDGNSPIPDWRSLATS